MKIVRKTSTRVKRIITLPFCVRWTFYRVNVKDAHPANAAWAQPRENCVVRSAC